MPKPSSKMPSACVHSFRKVGCRVEKRYCTSNWARARTKNYFGYNTGNVIKPDSVAVWCAEYDQKVRFLPTTTRHPTIGAAVIRCCRDYWTLSLETNSSVCTAVQRVDI